MRVMPLQRLLTTLLVLYCLALLATLIASVPMLMHVYPQSECLLFAFVDQQRYHYGHYATCNVVGYAFLATSLLLIYLVYKAIVELRSIKGHHPHGEYVRQKAPGAILWVHFLALLIALTLATITTAGYFTACNNIHDHVSLQVQEKLNSNPYDTRGEEIQTRFEDDYKFHRYTSRYGNAFGNEFYTIRITCRSIFTDPEVYQRLHETHYEQMSRYYGYWYGQDLYAFDSQSQASKTNALIELCLVSGWITLLLYLAGFVVMLVQRFWIRRKQIEDDRLSVHSAMLGSACTPAPFNDAASGFRKTSVISGPPGSFQRGSSMRGSDRSLRSSRRDIDELALQSILDQRGRDHQRRLSLPRHQPQVQMPGLGSSSRHSSRETGYISGEDFSRRQSVPHPPSSKDTVETSIF